MAPGFTAAFFVVAFFVVASFAGADFRAAFFAVAAFFVVDVFAGAAALRVVAPDFFAADFFALALPLFLPDGPLFLLVFWLLFVLFFFTLALPRFPVCAIGSCARVVSSPMLTQSEHASRRARRIHEPIGRSGREGQRLDAAPAAFFRAPARVG
ncbi:hypothetical protein K2X89_04855 [Myxococcota bacterium]|nr:hypothetical protein [Myxococcota bacterium]